MHNKTNQTDYIEGSISLAGAVAMGTGVMIGAGIFALTGQIAELAGQYFPLAFIAGAIVTGFSAYSYIKMSNAWPSSGGIAMILQKCYGPGAVAAGAALLMALSMVIAESLVQDTDLEGSVHANRQKAHCLVRGSGKGRRRPGRGQKRLAG